MKAQLSSMSKQSTFRLSEVNEVLPFQIAHDPIGKMLPSQFWPQEQKPRTVGISVSIIQISEINIETHSFKVYLRVYLDWPATVDECKQYWMRNQDHFSIVSRGGNSATNSFLSFQPWDKFLVLSQESLLAREWTEPKLVYVDKHERYFIKTNAEFRCTCVHKFDLTRFPCDIQDVPIMFQLGTGSKSIKWAQLVPIHSRPVIVKIERKHSVLDEYYFDENSVFTFFQNSDPKESSVYCSTSSFRVIIKMQRMWQVYFYRIGVVLSGISLASNGVFFIYEGNLVDGVLTEISFVSTLLMVGIAYMFIVYDTLPHTPYLTYIDYYCNMQVFYIMSLLMMICVTEAPEDEIDYRLIISITMFFVYHFILCTIFTYGHFQESAKLEFNSLDYSSAMNGTKTISLPNVSRNWRFGHRYPGAKEDDLVKGPRRYLESFKHLYSRQSLLLEWNYDHDLPIIGLEEENSESDHTSVPKVTPPYLME